MAWAHSDAELLEMLRRRDAGETYREIGKAMGKTIGQLSGVFAAIDDDLAASERVPRFKCRIW